MHVGLADLPAQHLALKAELAAAFDSVMASCRFILGPQVTQLEEDTAAHEGAKFGVGVNSGTDALLISLLALGVGPGDEVITTPFTFVATAETIALAGAIPVFADIDPRTFNLDAQSTAEKITPRTKAIVPVHLFGQLADMQAFTRLAQEHHLSLVGDGAQAIGATHHGKAQAAWSDTTTLSFFPTKNLGACGDGGMILTDREDVRDAARTLRFHGSGGGYFYKRVGYCSRLDELQAALLNVKMRYLSEWNDIRRAHAARYQQQLSDLAGQLTLPYTLEGNHAVAHQFTVRVPGGRRDDLQKHLAAQGVQSAIYYPLSLHVQEAYAYLGGREGDLPQSELATREVLSLPVHPGLTDDQIDFVCDNVRAFFA